MKLKTKFQDEDFELGEVVDASIMYGCSDKIEVYCTEKMKHRKYNSIKDLTDHWEDTLEEPKEHWAIDQFGEPINVSGLSRLQLEKLHRLGNDFPSENATMKAVERLRAWKRLKDKGFRFKRWVIPKEPKTPHIKLVIEAEMDAPDSPYDLDLLSGDEK